MILHSPFQISSRLLPALYIGGAWLQLEALPRDAEGRTVYRYTIDLPDRKNPVRGEDLRSGCQGGTLQEGFGSLLAFLSAEAEEEGIFESHPLHVWAKKNSDEIGMLQCDIEESETPLIEP